MRVESQVENAGRETASDEVWVRILEKAGQNTHTTHTERGRAQFTE